MKIHSMYGSTWLARFNWRLGAIAAWLALLATASSTMAADEVTPLPGTQPLTLEGDIASHLVAGVDQFLLDQLDLSVGRRARHWKRDTSSPEAYGKSINSNRQRLAHILGVRDARTQFDGLELLGTTSQAALVGQAQRFRVLAVRWPAFGDVHGEGLLLVPMSEPAVGDVVAIPAAHQVPEHIVGLVAGVAPESQYARRLANSGFRVLVPLLINRSESEKVAGLTNREYLYRSAFELGRHLIGYEVQKVLAAIDWFTRQSSGDASIGVMGWGEGGLLSLYAGALDPRIDAVCVSGYFADRREIWREPIDRNVFGLLEQFGDAELASMIAPRALVVEAAQAPELTLPPGGRGAPARLVTPKLSDVTQEFERAKQLVAGLRPQPKFDLIVRQQGHGQYGSATALQAFINALAPGNQLAPVGDKPQHERAQFNPHARHQRQMHELDRHNQWLLRESSYVREKFMARVKTGSIEQFEESIQPLREFFHEEIIGKFDIEPLTPNVRTRKAYDRDKWVGYEVVMDVFPNVVAYGILLLPKDIRPGEKRPVVVCQHGLEGRPQHVIGKEGYRAYKAFAARLAERGYITFAPQNLYIFRDRFRTLQRKSNPLKKTLFSIIVPQHQQIVNWLKSLPQVAPERIAFYGLSYGGKTAMRVPPFVADYCLAICSADFNEWVDKNASTRNPHSYVNTGEYEIFEFDLGSTFNYAEMAALIAPRPFMVERGHFDGVASDETVAREFAKVRYLYAAQLLIPDRCRIEWFAGPHTINGQGTFEFLDQHLR